MLVYEFFAEGVEKFLGHFARLDFYWSEYKKSLLLLFLLLLLLLSKLYKCHIEIQVIFFRIWLGLHKSFC